MFDAYVAMSLLYLIVVHDDLTTETYHQLEHDSIHDPRFYQNATKLFIAHQSEDSDDWLFMPIPFVEPPIQTVVSIIR